MERLTFIFESKGMTWMFLMKSMISVVPLWTLNSHLYLEIVFNKGTLISILVDCI